MKEGKISNTILDRSVFKLLSKKGDSLLCERPAVGRDYSALSIGQENVVVTATACGVNAVYNAANNIAVSGAIPAAVQCGIVMPAAYREIALKRVMQRLNDDCRQLGIEISGGHTQVSGAVSEPVITVTGIGMCKAGERLISGKASEGDDIIATKWIGIGGVQQIIDLKRDEITARFNDLLVEKAYGSRKDLSVSKEAQIGLEMGVSAMHDVSCGGIYAALWDLAECSQLGLSADFRKLPVCQEIIEICEMYNLNPYELDSTGCLLMTSKRGCDIVNVLQHRGISAVIIGKMVSGNDRLIRNEDETRFLETPKADELYRFYAENKVGANGKNLYK